MEDDNYYIGLNKNPIRFEPVSKANNVFFDDANKQVFAVRSRGAMGVVMKGPEEKASASFRMEDRGDMLSIKFSPDKKILAAQRSLKTVEFINFLEDFTTDQTEYSQACKGKTTEIRGFVWSSSNEIIFVTSVGLEQYQVIPEKRLLKSLKNISLQVNWYVWLNSSSLLLVSSGTLGNTLHPFQFKSPGVITRLPKFDVDLSIIPRPPKLSLLERDVIIATIYENVYVVILRHPQAQSTGAELVLYQLQKEGPARKTDILKLDMSGRFAINVVDNLIMVHHQASKTSVIFDIKLEGKSDGFVNYHYPVLSPLGIKPFKLLLPSVNMQAGTDKTEYNCELYSANWIVFQPDIVIDAKLGCLWTLQINLQPLVTMIPDKDKLIQFLLNRSDSKSVILNVCAQMLVPGKQASLQAIAKVYDLLNLTYKQHLDTEAQLSSGDSVPAGQNKKVVVEQPDMFTHVFSIFEDYKDIKYKFMVAVLIEYIRSLHQFNIPVQHYVYELIINILVHNNCFYQLHQFLQYHVLSDSKPLACLMLSLETVYPPAHQLALDMLKRIQTANEEIIEVLLSKQQLLPALRFIRSVGNVESASARKFLEAALNTNDNMIFYTVFKFFEQRNVRSRQNPRFQTGEHCEQYVKQFESLFGSDAFMPAPPIQ
ncbi:regulator of MON1-CCZ1 complex-like isoform X2 [Physella acuta]|uniref:regulator of MON1-CCZ1 complex-like isoform X2 n=1 Tax=Physella acuta TaxID=109671 RepID=UPI0027DCBB7C|nr:regulator of MON1-CCZ1 complex-like isoform X2 [Physella acuta]